MWGKQYIDNTSDEDKSIGSYFVSSLSAGYTFPPRAKWE